MDKFEYKITQNILSQNIIFSTCSLLIIFVNNTVEAYIHFIYHYEVNTNNLLIVHDFVKR